MLSNPVEIEVEDVAFQEHLNEYYDEDLPLFLQEALEGSSVKGLEYAYATTAQDRLKSSVSDSLSTFDVYDDNGGFKAVVHYFKWFRKPARLQVFLQIIG